MEKCASFTGRAFCGHIAAVVFGDMFYNCQSKASATKVPALSFIDPVKTAQKIRVRCLPSIPHPESFTETTTWLCGLEALISTLLPGLLYLIALSMRFDNRLLYQMRINFKLQFSGTLKLQKY